MNKSQLTFSAQLPLPRTFPAETVLFYDSILVKNKSLKVWIKKFPFQVVLKAGESLKTLSSLENVLNRLDQLEVPQTTDLTFIALGGGSVGDFVGFMASVYLRGRRLIHIPSTWLAAVDSAHGGKNGLNRPAGKNQIGSFYPAEKIFIVSKLLQTQPTERIQEALGEFIKMAIIGQPKAFNYLEKHSLNINSKKMLTLLPSLIKNKNRIVQQDPFEKNGRRRVLNLGHTMGHVFESHFGWPHGLCVMLGILFSLRWSYHLKLCNEATYIRISNLIEDVWPEQTLSDDLAAISSRVIELKLAQDKKRTSNEEINFIFVRNIGAVIRKKIKIKEILAEVQRQIKEY